jgi:DNA-binding HxlR family transcriptional regulator
MSSYDQFCPIARAADILCQRWTLLILRDLHSGCRRFNELKRGVPRISPTLLTQRLRMLEDFGLVRREEAEGGAQYTLTRAGRETGPLLLMFGIWGRRWMQHKIEAGELDEAFLIYAIETSLDVSCLAPRAVVHIAFNDRPKLKWDRWWLLVEDDNVQSCFDDPGRGVDVQIESDLRTLTEIWRGAEPIKSALQDGRIIVDGERRLVERFEVWFRGSLFNIVDLPPASINVPALLERFERA